MLVFTCTFEDCVVVALALAIPKPPTPPRIIDGFKQGQNQHRRQLF